MKQENFDYMRKQVFYTGFGNELDEKLETQMNSGVKQFELDYSKNIGKDQVSAKLHFSKSEQGYYFFNKFEVFLQKENSNQLSRTFFIDKENNYTFKEAYNLLDGRYVNKDKKTKANEVYNVWEKLDFTQKDKYGNYPAISYGERYGFDPEKKLSELPIKGLMNGESREFLMDSLRRGNRQEVRMKIGSELVERHIEANVKLRRIEIYDEKGVNVTRDLKTGASQSQKEEQSKGEKAGQNTDEEPAAKASNQKNDKGRKSNQSTKNSKKGIR